MNRTNRLGRCARGMTLLEIIVVIAIVVILIAILLPQIGRTRT